MYLIFKNQEQQGPFSIEEIQQQVAIGSTSLDDLFWLEEAQQWTPIRAIVPAPIPQTNEAQPPPEIANHSQTKKSAKPKINTALHYAAFIQDKQPPKIVAKIYEQLHSLLAQGETIRYIAVQKKPFLNFSPEIAALTNERIFLFYHHLFRLRCDDYSLKEILNIEFNKGIFGSHFTFKSVDGCPSGILYLPKIQGEKIYNLACAAQEKIRVATQVKVPPKNNPLPHVANMPYVQNTADLPHQPVLKSEADTRSRLETLKKLLEDQLITEQDYETKKKDLLSRL